MTATRVSKRRRNLRTRLHVMRHLMSRGWVVRRDGHLRALRVCSDEAAALRYARELQVQHRCPIHVHDAAGRVVRVEEPPALARLGRRARIRP